MPRGRKPNQPELPGCQDPNLIPEINAKAVEYAAARDRRIDEGKEEHKLKVETVDLMKKHELMEYRAGGVTVRRVIQKEGLEVTVDGGGGGDDEEQD